MTSASAAVAALHPDDGGGSSDWRHFLSDSIVCARMAGMEGEGRHGTHTRTKWATQKALEIDGMHVRRLEYDLRNGRLFHPGFFDNRITVKRTDRFYGVWFGCT